jgi:hypothetical protein
MHRLETAVEHSVRRSLEKGIIARETTRREVERLEKELAKAKQEFCVEDDYCNRLEEEAKKLGLDLSRLGEEVPLRRSANTV